MNNLLLIFSVIALFFLILKIWNKYSREYNHNILRKSRCKNCHTTLGDHSLKSAIIELQKEKEELKRNANLGTIKLHNMILICQNCGTENFERDLYKARGNN